MSELVHQAEEAVTSQSQIDSRSLDTCPDNSSSLKTLTAEMDNHHGK